MATHNITVSIVLIDAEEALVLDIATAAGITGAQLLTNLQNNAAASINNQINSWINDKVKQELSSMTASEALTKLRA